MSDNKKCFLLYVDSLDVVDEMSVEQKAELFQAIIDFNKGKEPMLTGLMKAVFVQFKNQFERDAIKYEAVKEKRSLAGKQGGRPKKEEESSEEEKAKKANAFSEKQTEAKKAVTVNVTDTDTDNKLNTVSASRKSNKKIFKVETPKEIQLPFETESFKLAWKIWIEYRWNEKRQRFKSADSEHAQLKHLFELSGGNESDAIAIINQSIGNQYTGLFQLKTKPNQNAKNSGTTANSQPWRI